MWCKFASTIGYSDTKTFLHSLNSDLLKSLHGFSLNKLAFQASTEPGLLSSNHKLFCLNPRIQTVLKHSGFIDRHRSLMLYEKNGTIALHLWIYGDLFKLFSSSYLTGCLSFGAYCLLTWCIVAFHLFSTHSNEFISRSVIIPHEFSLSCLCGQWFHWCCSNWKFSISIVLLLSFNSVYHQKPFINVITLLNFWVVWVEPCSRSETFDCRWFSVPSID